MTWSFSRLRAFEDCKYRWFLKYIAIPNAPQVKLFFSSFGSFVHSLLERFHRGELTAAATLDQYLIEYPDNVGGDAPNQKVRLHYFKDGLAYFQTLQPSENTVLSVEEQVEFSLGGRPFIGYLDLLEQSPKGELILTDNKSRVLKPRSKRAKPTKTDQELDEYLRQLYLYSVFVAKRYGRTPDLLCFNCFRAGLRIEEPYREEAAEEAKTWAATLIDQIIVEEEFPPDIEFFKCRYLCDMREHCEFYELNRR